MALIDKASLLMVPSTYEAGKLYNVLPSGNRAPDSTDQNNGYDQTRADFDFDRGSNAAATRVNASGLIEKYRENLLTQSNNFSDSDWSNSGISLTSGQEDPFGGNNAWRYLMTGSIGASYLYQDNRTINASPMVLSFWVKSNTGSNQTFRATANSGAQSSPDFTATTEWQRISWFFVSSAGGNNILLAYNPTTNVDLVIYGAQFEQSLVASSYLESTSVTGKAGVLVDLPRINYDANGKNGSLLLEPSRANLFQYSEYIGASYWTKSNLSVATNNAISPSGLQDSNLVTLSAGTSVKQFYSGTFTAITNAYAFSGFFKKGTHNFIQLLAGPTDIVNFDLTLGTYNSPSSTLADIEDYGNGWFRCTMLASGASSSISVVNILAVDSLDSTRGQSTASTGNFYAWGLQVEASATYPSSYIPTMGTSETRAADVSSISELQTSSILNGTKGTFLFEGIKKRDWYFTNFVITTDGSNTNKSLLIDNSGSAIRLRAWDASSSIDATIITSAVSNGTFKYLIRWDNGNLKVFINGVSAGTASINAYSYTTLNLKEGSWSNNSLKQLIGFNEALTDAECVTLTTL